LEIKNLIFNEGCRSAILLSIEIFGHLITKCLALLIAVLQIKNVCKWIAEHFAYSLQARKNLTGKVGPTWPTHTTLG
jgi:hypothetical protein